MEPRTELDPFAVEIIRSGLVATTQEMKTNLMRTAYHPIVYESQDFTVALTDRDGNLISIGLGLPSFIRGISNTVKGLIKHFGTDVHPGDVLLSNDPQYHGSHQNHVIMALPVFDGDEVVSYCCAEPHWADIGGILGHRTDIYSSGVILPHHKIYDKGVLNTDVVSIIEANVRNPELAMGDFRGEVACVRTGEKRILHMSKKYGRGFFLRSLETIMDQSEAFARREVSKIPEGTYEAEQFLDDDGIDVGKHMNLRVKVIVKGDTMTVDLSGVDKQVRGDYNSGAGVSGAQMGFKTIVSPLERPINDGAFRPLKVILPPGTFLSASKPAAVYWWMIPTMNVADTMWKAMAPVIPERIAAGHFATLPGGGNVRPINPKTGLEIFMRVGVGGGGGGGWGAKYNSDGMPACHCLNDGDGHSQPVEAGESHNHTAIVLRRELRQDSGGAGKFRGGLGTITEVAYFWDGVLNTNVERTVSPPWGALGAKPALPNAVRVGTPKKPPTGDELTTSKIFTLELDYENYPNPSHPNAKVFDRRLKAGSRLSTLVGGGGGFGRPFERAASRVLGDVVNGYVSVESARRDYGVVVDPETLRVDEKATASLRAA